MVYGHRGASAYAPENTMSAFKLALKQGANGIETDVKMTKDGVLILFHDDDMMRLTGVEGVISDYTYEELSALDVIGGENMDMTDKIPTFESFLKAFSKEDIAFAIELKQDGIEKAVVDMLDKYEMYTANTRIISFSIEHLRNVSDYSQNYELGYLVREYNEQITEDMSSLGITLISPKTKILDKKTVKSMHDNGFVVQSWGAYIEKSIKYTYNLGVDAMVVDQPDILINHMITIHSNGDNTDELPTT